MQPRHYHFWVHITSNRSHNLYVGFTNNIRVRIEQHRQQTPGAHTTRYQIGRLVYYVFFRYVLNGIAREKELKRWTRAQKIALIQPVNPTWEELMLD